MYHKDDLFFDIEIRGNFFVCSQYYPAQKKLVVSYLEQVPGKRSPNPQEGFLQTVVNNGPDDYSITPNSDHEKFVADLIKKTAHAYDDKDIVFENLATPQGVIDFAKRYGYIPKMRHQFFDFDCADLKRRREQESFPILFDTDKIQNLDCPNQGRRIGYNSQNYDQTMLAYYIGNTLAEILNYYIYIKDDNHGELNSDIYDVQIDRSQTTKQVFYNTIFPDENEHYNIADAANLCDFNKVVFSPSIKYMNNALKQRTATYDSSELIYRLWKISNRFIDVSNMNPKHISLKRCAMAMGLKIEESSTNRSPNAKLNTLKDIAEVVAYNANDVYITMKVLELGLYNNRFQQNQQLLKDFDYLTYRQDPQAAQLHVDEYNPELPHIKWVTGQDNIRLDRLTINDTSTKFVENVIAPYDNTKIQDNNTLNLTYPDAQIAREAQANGKLPKLFHGHPRNVLDYVQDLLNRDYQTISPDLARRVQHQYDKIKAYYRQFIGKNFNEERTKYTLTNLHDMPKNVIVPYVTPDGIYHDRYGTGLASYAVISVGGAHGVEVRQAPYQKDYEEYQTKLDLVKKTIDAFNNLTPDQYHELFEDADHDSLGFTVTKETLGQVIAKLHPDLAFTKVKKSPLISDPSKTYQDLLTKSASRKNPRLAQIKEPSLFKGSHVDKNYAYTSSDPSNHEDFDSYYPSLISNLAIFRNADHKDVFTMDLYHPRLALKKIAKGKVKNKPDGTPYTEQEVAFYNLRQLSMKLLINAASGGGDASFSSRIKCNNKMIAMRIIGQLFCWYIGQTLALHGARVPSTNTDGLYTMNIAKDLNDKLVEHCAYQLLLGIGPEHLTLFVSKDANNRLEANGTGDKSYISSARGGSLTSWQGPSPQNAIAHPAIVDWVLAQYLGFTDDAVNHEFNRDIARHYIHDFVSNPPHFYGQPDLTDADILRFFQFPTVANPNTGRYIFKLELTRSSKPKFEILNPTNRVFLVKPGTNPNNEPDYTVAQTGLQVVQVSTARKRLAANSTSATGAHFRDIIGHGYSDPVAIQVMKENMGINTYSANILSPKFNPKATHAAEKPRDVKVIKISGFPEKHPALIYNEDLHEISHKDYQNLMTNRIDYDAYLDMVESSFNKQWKNIIVTNTASNN